MSRKIIVTLIILGADPSTNAPGVVLTQSKGMITADLIDGASADFTAVSLSSSIIDAPIDWYVLKKQTFYEDGDTLNLVYKVIIPRNIRLKSNKYEWVSRDSLFNSPHKNIILLENLT